MITLYVVIPLYNGEKYIETAVNSILSQPYKNIEIVLVDDGSSDNSPAICENLAAMHNNIRTIHKKNGGVSTARNAGINYILSHFSDDELGYFAFLDADDLWYKNSVSDEILSEINAGQYDIISFSCYCSNTSVDRLSISNVYQNKSIQISMGGTTEWLLDSHLGSNFFRCSLIRDNGLRFMETIQYNEDIIFMREALFCAKKVSLRSNFLHIYRANATSVTHRRKCLISTATDIAQAWYQVGDWAYGIDVPQAQRENWKAFCVSISASRLLEAARNLAEAGYTVVEINKCIQSVSFCRNIELLHPEEMAAWQSQDLMMYKTNFRKFVLVHRIRGGIHRISKLLLKIRAVQIIREKQKFPIRMS